MNRAATLLTAALLTGIGGEASADGGLVGEPSLEEDMLRYPPTSVRYAVLTGGVGMFGIAYGLSAMSAAVWPEVPSSKALYAPVVGPMIALADSGCAEDDPDCGAIVYVRGVLYVVDTLVQIGGLSLLVEGMLMTSEAEEPETAITVAPWVTPTQTGVGVVGHF